jgi:hypothetical protein
MPREGYWAPLALPGTDAEKCKVTYASYSQPLNEIDPSIHPDSTLAALYCPPGFAPDNCAGGNAPSARSCFASRENLTACVGASRLEEEDKLSAGSSMVLCEEGAIGRLCT